MAENYLDRAVVALENSLSSGHHAGTDARARLRAHQVNRFMSISPVLMVANIINATILAVALNWSGLKWPVTLWLGLIASFGLLALLSTHRYRSRGERQRVSVRTVRRLAISSGLLGAMWGAMPLLAYAVLTPSEMSLLFTFLAGMIGGGCIVLGFVPAAMYAWILGMASFGLTGLIMLPTSSATILLLGTLVYASVLIHTGRAYGSAFAQTAFNEMKMREQASTIEILLKEYEDGGRDWIWQTDGDNRMVRGIKDLVELTRLPRQTVFAAMNGKMSDDESGMIGLKVLRKHIARRKPVEDLMMEIRHEHGQNIWFKVSGKPLYDDNGDYAGYRGVVCDVTDAVRNEQNVKWLAHHDALTGLANRASFNQFMTELFAQKRAAECTLFYLDLNAFKAINDTMGHAAGDLVLQMVAKRLKWIVPENAELARIGGDEFLVAVPEMLDENETANLASTIHSTLCETISHGGRELRVGCGIGIAAAPRDAGNPEDLMHAADLALYAVKADPDVNWREFQQDLEEAQLRERALEMALRDAVHTNAIAVHYQPFYNTKDQRLVGFEALARWEHAEFGLVPPAEFIPLAERMGLIAELGAHVLNEACLTASHWPDGLKLAVNMSVAQFRYSQACDAVRAALETSGLPAEKLEVEVTEQVFAEDTDQVRAEMDAIRALGVSISLDDFGTGYSSLHYVMNFPFDKLKIDRSFIDLASRDGRAHKVLETMAQLSASLDVVSTVEGIETEAQLDMVRNLGFTLCQGYLFSKPVPSTELASLVLREQAPESAKSSDQRIAS